MLSTNSNIKHFFGRKDFIVPNNERVIFLNQVHGDKVIDLEDFSVWKISPRKLTKKRHSKYLPLVPRQTVAPF